MNTTTLTETIRNLSNERKQFLTERNLILESLIKRHEVELSLLHEGDYRPIVKVELLLKHAQERVALTLYYIEEWFSMEERHRIKLGLDKLERI